MRKLLVLMTICASLSSFAGTLSYQAGPGSISGPTGSSVPDRGIPREPFREP